MTRAGFVGYGLLHLAVAWLALEIAWGHPATTSDQGGAFRLLARQPLGRPLLWAIIVGLAAMAIWQLTEAIAGHRLADHRAFERIVSVGRVIVYLALAWTAYRVAAGAAVSSAGDQQAATAGVLAHPAGRLLVTVAGLAVVGILLIQAAATYDASRSSGLDGALHTLAAKPFGVFLLVLVALGFAAFGGYCFVQSKYRKV